MGSFFSKSPPPAPPSKPVPEVAKLTSLQQAKFDMKVRRDKLERISKQHLKEQKVRAPSAPSCAWAAGGASLILFYSRTAIRTHARCPFR